MAFKDILNRLGALSGGDKEKLMQVLSEGTAGFKQLYTAVRDEIRYGLASDNVHPEEYGRSTAEAAPAFVRKTRVTGETLDMNLLADLKKTLPQVTVNEIFIDLIGKSRELVDQIHEAVASKDMDDLNEKAHNLKGMAGNFGLAALMAVSAELEKAGLKNDPEKAAEHIPSLRPILKETLEAVDAWQKS